MNLKKLRDSVNARRLSIEMTEDLRKGEFVSAKELLLFCDLVGAQTPGRN